MSERRGSALPLSETRISGTRIRLDIAYDGTAFAGWGRQPALRTVQGVLEETLATIVRRHGEPPRLTVAGRTDAGVHATGQVAHLDLTAAQLASLKEDGPAALVRRVNGILGLDSDVVVRGARVAPEGFDARFSAVWRRYEYRVADTAAPRDPLSRAFVVTHPVLLDVDAMAAAASELVGLHDWAAFCRPREGSTTIRTLQEFAWRREPGTGVLVATVRADAFCHSMVRALVGASIAVGAARLGGDDVRALRDARERTSAFIVAPAKGLTLVEVGYPPDGELAARALQTRAMREPVTPRHPSD
ncbi:tRNA pseudouridine(38-40) synthase TruA [Galbitalea sp. SE-J8]|uniref:tRNA pseudouridine(38-40) synthase TruA n=1 Tax=Galbitalea sp. SE-J8 TaxID=3054952 RepID=UPI00259CBB7F|nr:tRNA pseudouridine(38-40) synthase TruA [Galbitalea sp. SE-J8]MDM4761461.1 tRNA pseudouridine(38-40) synthase TruA [Galbitalea sp. SE-J8]